jgi:hypothetical protein
MNTLDSRGNEQTCGHYLVDLGRLLKEQAFEAKREAKLATDPDKAFQKGKLLAYHEIVSLMQQQAKVFGLPLHSIGLEDIDPETDLL